MYRTEFGVLLVLFIAGFLVFARTLGVMKIPLRWNSYYRGLGLDNAQRPANTTRNEQTEPEKKQNAYAKDLVAVCFFGQVKNYERVASSVRKHVISPLEADGFGLEFYAHTYNQTSITNPRNHEWKSSIDPTSLEKYFSTNESYNISIIYDDVAEADQSFNVTQLLTNGDPWPDNPVISVRNMVRQLYSLRRLTQLWAPSAARYKYCLYLRPDLLFTADLDLNRTLPRLDNRTLATPAFAQFRGLNDRLALATPAVMRLYGLRSDRLLDFVLRLRKRPHAESFLLHAMSAHGVRNLGSAVRFARMRADGRTQ